MKLEIRRKNELTIVDLRQLHFRLRSLEADRTGRSFVRTNVRNFHQYKMQLNRAASSRWNERKVKNYANNILGSPY